PLECTEGVRAADAVGIHPATTLEFAHCRIGIAAEHAVSPTGVESKLIQPALQFRDIVSAHHRAGNELEHAIAELPPCLVEAAEGVRADNAVGRQATLLLESANCHIAVVIEHIAVLGIAEESQVRKPCAHLRDGRPGRTQAEQHYRYGARSASSAAFGLAPMIDFTIWPPWKMCRVGMLVMP
ncbi:MAG: hypothetical protein RL205_715, partial [Actinomycetota bacterium]